MQNIIVTVKLSGNKQEYDLEVPAGVPAQQLAELITHNISSGTATKHAFTIHCLRPVAFKRTLRFDESLAEAGLWDGVYLEIEPVGAATAAMWQDVLLGWVPLEESNSSVEDSAGTNTGRHVRLSMAKQAESTPAPAKHVPPVDDDEITVARPSMSDLGPDDESAASDVKQPSDDGYTWKAL
jgi:hypothetical protein